jgi:hypothetical protein
MHCQLACAEIRAGVRTVASFHLCTCIGVVHGNTNHASTGKHTGNHTSHPSSRRPSESITRFLSTPSLDGAVLGGRQVLEPGGAGEGDPAASRTREPGMVGGVGASITRLRGPRPAGGCAAGCWQARAAPRGPGSLVVPDARAAALNHARRRNDAAHRRKREGTPGYAAIVYAGASPARRRRTGIGG